MQPIQSIAFFASNSSFLCLRNFAILFIAFTSLYSCGSGGSSASASEQIVLSYFNEVPIPGSKVNIGAENELLKGLNLIREGKTGEGVKALEVIATSSDNYAPARFFIGQTYFKEKEYSKAAQAFSQVSNPRNSRQTAMAQWYRVLSSSAAGLPLEEVINPILLKRDHPYYFQAVEFAKKLQTEGLY